MKYRARPAELEAVEFQPPPDSYYNGLPSAAAVEQYHDIIVGGIKVAWKVRYVDTEGRVQWCIHVEKSRAWCNISRGDYIAAELDGSGVYPIERATFEKRWFAPVEVDNNVLHLNHTMDAAVWAKAFSGVTGMDEAWALSWFANAIMAGWDAAKRKPVWLGPHLLFDLKALAATFGLELAPEAENERLRIPVAIKGWDASRGDVVALIHHRPDGSYLLTWRAAP